MKIRKTVFSFKKIIYHTILSDKKSPSFVKRNKNHANSCAYKWTLVL